MCQSLRCLFQAIRLLNSHSASKGCACKGHRSDCNYHISAATCLLQGCNKAYHGSGRLEKCAEVMRPSEGSCYAAQQILPGIRISTQDGHPPKDGSQAKHTQAHSIMPQGQSCLEESAWSRRALSYSAHHATSLTGLLTRPRAMMGSFRLRI